MTILLIRAELLLALDFEPFLNSLSTGRNVGIHAAVMPRFWSSTAEMTIPRMSSNYRVSELLCLGIRGSSGERSDLRL